MANIQTAAYKAATQKARALGYASVEDATARLRAQGKADNGIGVILGVNKSTFYGWCNVTKETAAQPAPAQPRSTPRSFVFNYEFPDEPRRLRWQATIQSSSCHDILDDSDRILQTWSQTLGGRS